MNVDQYISSGVLELYALHALPPEEMKQVEDMVDQYPRIKDELNAISEGLKKYAEQYAPQQSEDLYDKIIGRINQLNDGNGSAEPPVSQTPLVAIKSKAPEEPKQEKSKVKQLPDSGNRSSSPGGWYWMSVAACIVLLIVSVGLNLYYYSAWHDTQDKLVAMQHDKDAVAQNNAALKAKYDETEAHLQVYTDPHSKMVMMNGLPISPASEVMVLWNTASKDVYVDVHRLPTPPDGMQYQLWALDENGKPVDAGMLTPYKDRKEKGMEEMNKKIVNATAFAITLERKGGSPTPTMDKMYVMGKVSV